MNKKFLVLFIFLSISYSVTAQAEVVEEVPAEGELVKDNLLDKFCGFLKGEFNSASQNAKDTNYFNISLVMFPIWDKEKDAKYFYVEQAMVGKEDKPYRQRVYKVYQSSPNTIVSAIYTLKKQEEFVNLHENVKKQKTLSKTDIDYKEGCDVFLEYDGTKFKGGTSGKKCSSNLRGAKYATTEVEVYEDRLISWDRGFTENGIHAWGTTAGGYVFEKIK